MLVVDCEANLGKRFRLNCRQTGDIKSSCRGVESHITLSRAENTVASRGRVALGKYRSPKINPKAKQRLTYRSSHTIAM
ncbi:hypothetical protein J6590_082616 [Homalodisca vitripennis]|nr:hypothetical protein J6590_082616 [Homalodisca vitripennis]